jgi:acetyltransferase-like isoleucine patch superfamily enzyme
MSANNKTAVTNVSTRNLTSLFDYRPFLRIAASMLLFNRGSYVHFDDPLTFPGIILNKLFSLWVSLTYPFASVGRDLSIHSTCELHRHTSHRIQLGNSVKIHKNVWLNIAGPLERKGEPSIIIEDRCNIERQSMISARNCIHFEPDVLFGPAAVIMDHSHAYEDVARPINEQGVTEGGRIRIGQGCWIGHGAAIVCVQGKLSLGRNCVVAANSVVTRSFPAFSVISGNPARVVKQFDPAKQMWVLGTARPGDTDFVKTK